MSEGIDSMFNSLPVPSNVSYKSFTNYNVLIQNSYSDHRNIDSVNLRLKKARLFSERNSLQLI